MADFCNPLAARPLFVVRLDYTIDPVETGTAMRRIACYRRKTGTQASSEYDFDDQILIDAPYWIKSAYAVREKKVVYLPRTFPFPYLAFYEVTMDDVISAEFDQWFEQLLTKPVGNTVFPVPQAYLTPPIQAPTPPPAVNPTMKRGVADDDDDDDVPITAKRPKISAAASTPSDTTALPRVLRQQGDDSYWIDTADEDTAVMDPFPNSDEGKTHSPYVDEMDVEDRLPFLPSLTAPPPSPASSSASPAHDVRVATRPTTFITKQEGLGENVVAVVPTGIPHDESGGLEELEDDVSKPDLAGGDDALAGGDETLAEGDEAMTDGDEAMADGNEVMAGGDAVMEGCAIVESNSALMCMPGLWFDPADKRDATFVFGLDESDEINPEVRMPGHGEVDEVVDGGSGVVHGGLGRFPTRLSGGVMRTLASWKRELARRKARFPTKLLIAGFKGIPRLVYKVVTRVVVPLIIVQQAIAINCYYVRLAELDAVATPCVVLI